MNLFQVLIGACLTEAIALAAPADSTLPVGPPDWKLEVVAAAPQIRHPSVVCTAPDGRVFVAEDPMDISAPSANLALGRILCFHPDGRITVFAEKLYAVFGMQYLEGQLFVLHNPKFSVFRDDQGVGRDRRDLIESTNPNPWALDWNDHVPANFRLAMDGYFYVAVGDKGVFGAVGRDGQRVDLHGGGILRLRPDGTELEVYSTGVRNILDVALNAEDEIFTYDNTDEQQWMSRLTHTVEGGFYGYPYDFIPRRPYTLWMMADYGGGAATGTLAYNEDALPSEYRGNLFLADFGKRQILRVHVQRAGASYQAVTRQDVFSAVPGDFRPVGIALAPDGLSFYICDWNHADTKDKVEVGRLLKLTFTGRSQATRKPDWHLAAALGQESNATLPQLIETLSHPAQSVRLTAQRQIVQRFQSSSTARAGEGIDAPKRPDPRDAVRLCAELLSNSAAMPQARWHALWTLDGIDGGVAGRSAILRAVTDADASVRRQATRQLGTRRVKEAAALLVQALKDSDASVRFQAATTLGRMGGASAVVPLRAALEDKDEFSRYAAFTALNRIGRHDPSAWRAIVQGLESDRPAIREGTRFALRDTYQEPLVAALAGVARDFAKPAATRSEAVRLLAELHSQTPAWKGEWWAYHPVNAPPPVKNVKWAGTPAIASVLREAIEDSDTAVRRAAVDGLSAAKESSAAAKLREIFRGETDHEMRRSLLLAFAALKDGEARNLVASVFADLNKNLSVLGEAIGAAEAIGGDELAGALAQFLNAPSAQPALRLKAIDALGRMKSPLGVEPLSVCARPPDAQLRDAAIAALAKIGHETAFLALVKLLDEPSAEIRRSAIQALGGLKAKSTLPYLLEAFDDPATRAPAIDALAQLPDLSALDAYLAGLAGRNAQTRADCRKAIAALQKEALPLIEAKLAQLPAETMAELQRLFAKNPEARRGKLFTLEVKRHEAPEYLEFALNNAGDPNRGRALFQDAEGVGCVKCHALRGQGPIIGPDLATIGAQFSRRQLAESVLFPSLAVREGYQQIIAETKDVEVISGLLKAETTDDLVLMDAEGRLHRISKAKLKERRNSALSLMPEGLHETLSLPEFADLVAFLESLK